MKIILIAIIFHVLDYVTGLLGAIKRHKVRSAKLRDGLWKKFGFILSYFLFGLIDKFGYEVGFSPGFPVLNLLVTYSVLMEVISIIENIHEINPQLLPRKLLSLIGRDPDGDNTKKGVVDNGRTDKRGGAVDQGNSSR